MIGIYKITSPNGKAPWNKGVTGYTTSWKGRRQTSEGREKIREKLKKAWKDGKFDRRNSEKL